MPSGPSSTASTNTRASLAVTFTGPIRPVGVFFAAGTRTLNWERYSTPEGERKRVPLGKVRARSGSSFLTSMAPPARFTSPFRTS